MGNAIRFLTGDHRDGRLETVVIALAAEMLVSGGLAADAGKAAEAARSALASGRAAERFRIMVEALGGPDALMEKPDDHLPRAAVIRPVGAGRTGSVSAIDTRAIGVTVIALGGGRTRAADPIDHAVGLSDLVPLGTAVENDSPLAVVHARDEESFQQASGMIRDAYQLDGKPHEPAAIIERVS